ncbi:hypothetical protein AL542_10180 [Grimontia hollisae]|nr:hypothetical protein AL542_10180 [Grimontia hollisae]
MKTKNKQNTACQIIMRMIIICLVQRQVRNLLLDTRHCSHCFQYMFLHETVYIAQSYLMQATLLPKRRFFLFVLRD